MHLGNNKLAKQDFAASLRSEPERDHAYFNRGGKHLRKGAQLPPFIDYHNYLVRQKPKSAQAHLNRGRLYGQYDRHDKAISDINRAIELDPKRPLAFYDRGNSYAGKGQHDKAIEDYNEAIRLLPEYTHADVSRGFCYETLGKMAIALTNYKKAYSLGMRDSVLRAKLKNLASCQIDEL